jgi:hypothetical protein
MKLQRVDPTLRYGDTSINCISISRQPLRVVGFHLKIQGFSWNFPLVVVKGCACELILGSDFISKTGLVLDIAKQEFYFHFSPQKFRLAPSVRSNFCLQGMTPVSDTSKYAPVLDHLTHTQRARLKKVLCRFPDVLTRKLELTHLVEYEIHLKDGTPVRSSPYRLAPPTMEYLRQHIRQYLEHKDFLLETDLEPPKTSGEDRPLGRQDLVLQV